MTHISMPVITTTYVMDLRGGADVDAAGRRVPTGAHAVVLFDDEAARNIATIDRVGALLWDAASINVQAPPRWAPMVVDQIRRRVEGIVALERRLAGGEAA